jgi:hypothetical protein
MTTRPCEWCGKALQKPRSGPFGRFCSDLDAQPGQAPCRKQWHDEQRCQRRIAGRGEGRPCALDGCEELIPPDAHGNRRYCSPTCQGKTTYQAVLADPERLERHRERSRGAVARRRDRAEAVYGGRCVVCGATEALEFDHPNEDGNEHRQDESISAMLSRIALQGRLEDRELQLLCSRHHQIKTAVERGWVGDRVSRVAELHRAVEALLTYDRGRGIVLNPINGAGEAA